MRITFIYILTIFLIFNTGCIAPIIFRINDDRYKNEKPQVTIMPIYATDKQINSIQQISPFPENYDRDEDIIINNIYNVNREIESGNQPRNNIIYLFISTSY